MRQLEKLARHALRREYPHVLKRAAKQTPGDDVAMTGDDVAKVDERESSLADQLLDMARAASERFAFLAAEWLRVGYVQSNFNADVRMHRITPPLTWHATYCMPHTACLNCMP